MCWSAQADLAAGAVVSAVGLLCLGRARLARRAGRPGVLPLAALPLVLGVHQLIEAVVWLGVDGRVPAGWADVARTVWAVIALPLLPVLVPFGVWRAVRGGATLPPTGSDGRAAAPGAARATTAAVAPATPAGEPHDRHGPVDPADPADPAQRARRAGWTRRRAFPPPLLLASVFLGVGVLVSVPLALAVAVDPVSVRVDGHALAYGVGVPHPALLLAGYLLATVGSLLCSGDRELRLLGLLTGAGAAVCAVLWQTTFVSAWCALAALVSVVLLRWAGHAPRRPGPTPPQGATAPANASAPPHGTGSPAARPVTGDPPASGGRPHRR